MFIQHIANHEEWLMKTSQDFWEVCAPFKHMEPVCVCDVWDERKGECSWVKTGEEPDKREKRNCGKRREDDEQSLILWTVCAFAAFLKHRELEKRDLLHALVFFVLLCTHLVGHWLHLQLWTRLAMNCARD